MQVGNVSAVDTYSDGTSSGCKKARQEEEGHRSEEEEQESGGSCNPVTAPHEKSKACDPVDVKAGAQERVICTGF